MLLRTTSAFAALSIVFALATGCAAPSSDEGAPAPESATEDDLTKQLTDKALAGKLGGILRGVDFMSESDYPYVVLEGDKAQGTTLTESDVRQKLRATLKAAADRDIGLRSCRAEALDVNKTIAEGDAAQVPADKDDDNYTYALHDKQLGIALKVMRAQLHGLVGYTFGTNASGDQDDVGPVLYVYVGISKTSGKLVAIMTQAVYT